jgi:hypothetical protein
MHRDRCHRSNTVRLTRPTLRIFQSPQTIAIQTQPKGESNSKKQPFVILAYA